MQLTNRNNNVELPLPQIANYLFFSKADYTAHRKGIIFQYSTKTQAFAIWSIYILLIILACCIGKKSCVSLNLWI